MLAKGSFDDASWPVYIKLDHLDKAGPSVLIIDLDQKTKWDTAPTLLFQVGTDRWTSRETWRCGVGDWADFPDYNLDNDREMDCTFSCTPAPPAPKVPDAE